MRLFHLFKPVSVKADPLLTNYILCHLRSNKLLWKKIIACFFDVKRAFDVVWHRKLLGKIKNIGLSGNIYTYIIFFLQRTLQDKLRAALSKTYKTDCGVPQGTCLAPTLFNIMMSDLPHYLDSNLDKQAKLNYKLSQYADDIAIWQTAIVKCPDSKVKEIIPKNAKSFQKAIDAAQNYLVTTGFELSPDKTQLIFFIPSKVSVKVKFTI